MGASLQVDIAARRGERESPSRNDGAATEAFVCEIRRVATPTRNHSRQTCRGSQIGATASARSEVWELSWGRHRGAVPFGPSPEQQTVPGVTPVEIAYWLLKPPVAGKEKPRSCPTGARLMSDTHTRRALMLCPHGKHSTMLCG